MKRAYVEIMDDSIEIGTEHVKCPNHGEPNESLRGRPAAESEHHVEYACDAATRAIEDAEPKWRRCLRLRRVADFMLEWGIRIPLQLYNFDAMTHSQFDCCKWSCLIKDIPTRHFVEVGAKAARVYLTEHGYEIVAGNFR